MPIQPIDYASQRAALVAQLKGDIRFKDFNFEASGISTLINLLAYNNHTLGTYVYALLNEAHMDTAQTRQAIYSHARRLGYTPKGRKAALAEVVFEANVTTFPDEGQIVVHAGKPIVGYASREGSTRTFTNPDNVYLNQYERTANGYRFYSKPTTILEGTAAKWEFVVDASVKYQAFVIADETLDIDSLRVFIKQSDNDTGVEYQRQDSPMQIDAKTECFYTTVNHEGFVEIFFGNDVFGKQPTDGMIVSCLYVSSQGNQGNGCDKFTLPGFTIKSNETSNSGSDGESLESTRFNAVQQFVAQNRLLTPNDYRSIILSYFRNIQAINVWRGEDNPIRQYGKVFISVKPYFADRLSSSAKREIERRILDNHKRLGADPVFVDPEFIEVDVTLVLKTELAHKSVSVDKVNDLAIAAAREYNESMLNVFGNSLLDANLNQRIIAASPYILSSFTRKRLRKTQRCDISGIGTNTIVFGNPLISVSATTSTYQLYDKDGILYAKGELDIACGTVDYARGIITFTAPKQQQDVQTEDITFTAIPRDADINSTFNNIVRIAKVEVTHV